MILDTFKISQFIIQINYPNAFELWDKAGDVNRQLQKIWPDIDILENKVSPQQVVLANDKTQIATGINQSTLALTKINTIDQNSSQIVDTFRIWRNELALTKLARISSRVLYVKEFPSVLDANKELFALKLCRRPNTKVFDQPLDAPLNTIDITYRFEDKPSFAFLRIHVEQFTTNIEINSEFTALEKKSETKNRLIIDFDRGLKESVDAVSFRMDEWIKGFSHLLRRDLEKVIKD